MKARAAVNAAAESAANRREGKLWVWPSSFVTIKAAMCGQESISARPRCTPSRLTVVSRLSVVVASGPMMVA